MSEKKIATGKWEVRKSVYVEGERRHMKDVLKQEKRQFPLKKNSFQRTKAARLK